MTNRDPTVNQFIEQYENIVLQIPNGAIPIGYRNILLQNPGLVNGSYDPNVKATPVSAAGYWPSGIGPDNRRFIATRIKRDNSTRQHTHDERIRMRNLILGASIGEIALNRFEQMKTPQERSLSEMLGQNAVHAISAICSAHGAPLALVATFEVIESKKINPGEQQAFMFIPAGIPPKAGLSQIKRVVKEVIDQEMI